MIYEKNGTLRDSKRPLQTDSGKTIFNATPEHWEAEGWKKYEPPTQPVQKELSLEELKSNLIEECKSFYREKVLKFVLQEDQIWIEPEQRAAYIQILQDVLETSSDAHFSWQGLDMGAKYTLRFLKDLNIYEFYSKRVRDKHISKIQNLESREELENYDYKTGYSSLLTYKL